MPTPIYFYDPLPLTWGSGAPLRANCNLFLWPPPLTLGSRSERPPHPTPPPCKSSQVSIFDHILNIDKTFHASSHDNRQKSDEVTMINLSLDQNFRSFHFWHILLWFLCLLHQNFVNYLLFTQEDIYSSAKSAKSFQSASRTIFSTLRRDMFTVEPLSFG